MDQIKIGRFIAERRKRANLTQMQLAEKLGITDKAISKWERGLAMPDTSIMLELCDFLGVSVNELLNGEKMLIFKKMLGNTHVPHRKNTADMPAIRMAPPKTVTLPMSMHIGAPAVACVRVGDKVRVGDCVATPAEGALGAAIHASISGRVAAAGERIVIEKE